MEIKWLRAERVSINQGDKDVPQFKTQMDGGGFGHAFPGLLLPYAILCSWWWAWGWQWARWQSWAWRQRQRHPLRWRHSSEFWEIRIFWFCFSAFWSCWNSKSSDRQLTRLSRRPARSAHPSLSAAALASSSPAALDSWVKSKLVRATSSGWRQRAYASNEKDTH